MELRKVFYHGIRDALLETGNRIVFYDTLTVNSNDKKLQTLVCSFFHAYLIV